ncbi:MAG: discoidin domain-containing protein [Actinomycetota bacterium]|nr:discoidin domain-containing protein [Actinomycetota bacterium]
MLTTRTVTRGCVVATAGALFLLAVAAPSASAKSPGQDRPGNHGPASPTAHVWITTPDGQHKLTDSGTVSFGAAAPAHETITVDPTRTFQTMTGFGGSLTDSTATVLSGLSRTARDATMRQLFDLRTGDGLNFLRQPIGASDFVTDAAYTYDDLPAAATDYLQRHFSIAHDEKAILPLLRQARQINHHITVMATPWSPPAWMKTGGSLVGGQLINDPKIYFSYALYLAKFVQAYQRAGVPIDYLSVQNEPQNRAPSGYPGTDLSAAQEEKVIAVLGPMLRLAGLHTRILAYDHNWAEHPGDIATTPPNEVQDTNNYPQEVLSSNVRRYVAGTAYHCYYGDPSAMTVLHKQFPTKDIFFTECSGSQSSDPTQTFSDTLKFDARTLEIGATRNWAKSVVNWNLALDPSGGPHVGGCGTCTGILTVAADGTVTPDAEYYALGHLSRFVLPGAIRIASTSFGTTSWNGQIMDVAFRNRDGSTVLVAHNENDNPQSFSVSENGQSFDYTLPGGALATFVWRSAPRPAPALRMVDPTGWTATANPNGPNDPCCSGDVASHAIDDDASTRWSTGAGQTAGQFLQVDLGHGQRVRQLVLDTGAGTGDYPRGYTVTASPDGTRWTTVASGAGNGQLTTVELSGASVRYLRVTLTAISDSWWSVADVRTYVSNRAAG